MRKRGRDQVECAQVRKRRRTGCELTHNEAAVPCQLSDLARRVKAHVLDVDDVRRIRSDLRERDPVQGARQPRRGSSAAGEQGLEKGYGRALPVLDGPARLRRHAIDHDLGGLVAEQAEVVRVGVGRPKGSGHQLHVLLLEWRFAKLRTGRVVGAQKPGVIRVENENPQAGRRYHWAPRQSSRSSRGI